MVLLIYFCALIISVVPEKIPALTDKVENVLVNQLNATFFAKAWRSLMDGDHHHVNDDDKGTNDNDVLILF